MIWKNATHKWRKLFLRWITLRILYWRMKTRVITRSLFFRLPFLKVKSEKGREEISLACWGFSWIQEDGWDPAISWKRIGIIISFIRWCVLRHRRPKDWPIRWNVSEWWIWYGSLWFVIWGRKTRRWRRWRNAWRTLIWILTWKRKWSIRELITRSRGRLWLGSKSYNISRKREQKDSITWNCSPMTRPRKMLTCVWCLTRRILFSIIIWDGCLSLRVFVLLVWWACSLLRSWLSCGSRNCPWSRMILSITWHTSSRPRWQRFLWLRLLLRKRKCWTTEPRYWSLIQWSVTRTSGWINTWKESCCRLSWIGEKYIWKKFL